MDMSPFAFFHKELDKSPRIVIIKGRRTYKGEKIMAKEKKLVEAITSMEEDFAQWYTDVVKKAELIEYSNVKGCMILRPNGYAIWENIQKELDRGTTTYATFSDTVAIITKSKGWNMSFTKPSVFSTSY